MGKPWKNEFGIWIYPSLPEGMRIAIREDFLDEQGNIFQGIYFLVHSFHFDRYEVHKTTPKFLEKWEPWLTDNRIYIMNK